MAESYCFWRNVLWQPPQDLPTSPIAALIAASLPPLVADVADRSLDRRLVAALGRSDEGGRRALQHVCGRLELGRILPDFRKRLGLLVLGAGVEAIPGHVAQGLEKTGVARDDARVERDLALGHAGHRTKVLALQGHRRLALFDQGLGFRLCKSVERVTGTQCCCHAGRK
jgi:hypothetical protein